MPSKWIDEANFDSCYATWLEYLDRLCEQFLDIRYSDIKDLGDFDTHDAYYVQECRPEQFFKEVIVPYMQNEHGSEFINEHIGERVMWGVASPGPVDP
jgi:hypothetical protein